MNNKLYVFLSFMMAFLLIPSALAEKYDQYVIQQTYLDDIERIPYEDGEDTFYLESSGRNLRWKRNGETVGLINSENFPCLNWYTGVIRIDEGQFGILMIKDHRGTQIKGPDTDRNWKGPDRIEYWNWSGQTLELIRTWESDYYYTIYCDNGFLIYKQDHFAALYDHYAREIWHGSLGDGKEYLPYRLRMRSEDDWTCILNGQELAECCVRGVNGQIAWRRRFEDYSSRIMCALPLVDGWTIVTVSRNDGKYGPTKIYTLDPIGNIYSVQEITSDRKLLTSARLLFEAEDGVALIYGDAISHSRKIYLVWQLRFNVKNGTGQWNMRNCEYHEDYSPGFRAGTNTSTKEMPVSVMLEAMDDSNAPSVLVPFDILPHVNNSLLTLSPVQ